MKLIKQAFCLIGLLACMVACQKKDDPTATPTLDAPPAPAPVATPAPAAAAPTPAVPAPGSLEADAKALFAQRCTLCHGVDGRGNGPAAANLNPKPRNLGDAAWQASVKDEDLRKIILEGGAGVGRSMMMPPNPDLQNKPEIIAELVKIVRKFKK